MNEAMVWITPIIVAFISGVFAYLGMDATVKVSIARIEQQIEGMNESLERLEIKQDKHNNMIERVYKLEQKVEDLVENKQIRRIEVCE